MKEVIRRGIFETNSSSVHSITMCSDDMYIRWLSGDGVYYDYDDDKLVEISEEVAESDSYRYLTYNEYRSYDRIPHERFSEEYTTPSGETIHAFGYYGYDY